MTVYGYSRVSTKRQSQSRQNRAIKAEFPDAVLIEEVYTGTSIDRPKFTRLLKHLQPGDTVVFDSVSRMSRNAEEGFSLYKKLFNENINLVFINQRSNCIFGLVKFFLNITIICHLGLIIFDTFNSHIKFLF